jgi:putative transposase
MLLCKKIKIDVSERDAQALEFMQGKCRGLYNWWVMRLQNGEKWNFEQAKKSLRESKAYDPELRAVYGKLLAEVYFRLEKAMRAFFRRVKAGEKPGFPRFKPRHLFFTLCYPAIYLDKIEGNTIILPTGGGGNWGPKRYPNIVAHLTEEPPLHFHEVAVSRDARGNYSCSFVYDDAEQVDAQDTPHKQRGKRKARPARPDGIVAFDLGIKTLATGYTDQGRFYHIGGFRGYRWYNKQLDVRLVSPKPAA